MDVGRVCIPHGLHVNIDMDIRHGHGGSRGSRGFSPPTAIARAVSMRAQFREWSSLACRTRRERRGNCTCVGRLGFLRT